MKRIIVTGATGIVGISLIDECIKNNIEVIALVRRDSANVRRIPDSPLVKIIECDLDEMARADLDIRGDVFYHFGWSRTDKQGRQNSYLQQENIGSALNALELALRSGCSKFIGSGSQAEYGVHPADKTAPDTPLFPQDAYGAAKAAAGRMCSFEARKSGIDFAWVRIFSLYGKCESSGTLIQTAIRKMLNNEKLSLSPCTHRWDYLYSADAGEALFMLGERFSGNKVYCLGSGVGRPLRDYVTEMKDILGSGSELCFGDIPYPEIIPTGFCADISALETDIGWKPRTDFRTGIQYTVNYITEEES